MNNVPVEHRQLTCTKCSLAYGTLKEAHDQIAEVVTNKQGDVVTR